MAWYEKASASFPWLVRKEIFIIQFSKLADDGGHNQFAAKLVFRLIGFKIGMEYLLHVDPQSTTWGKLWEAFPQDGDVSRYCYGRRERVEAAIEKWHDYIARNKKHQSEIQARQRDRGTVISKYTR